MELYQTDDGWRLYLDLEVEPVRFWFSTNGDRYTPLVVTQKSSNVYEVESLELGKGTLTVGQKGAYLVLGDKKHYFMLCPRPIIPIWLLNFVGKK